jgi:hypothetical protein
MATLTQKAPIEVGPYRALVLESRMPRPRRRAVVAPEETAAIDQIQAALGT